MPDFQKQDYSNPYTLLVSLSLATAMFSLWLFYYTNTTMVEYEWASLPTTATTSDSTFWSDRRNFVEQAVHYSPHTSGSLLMLAGIGLAFGFPRWIRLHREHRQGDRLSRIKLREEIRSLRHASETERLTKATKSVLSAESSPLQGTPMNTLKPLPSSPAIHKYMEAQDQLATKLADCFNGRFELLRDLALDEIIYDLVLRPNRSDDPCILIELKYAIRTFSYQWFLDNIIKHVIATAVYYRKYQISTFGIVLFVLPEDQLDYRTLTGYRNRLREDLPLTGTGLSVGIVGEEEIVTLSCATLEAFVLRSQENEAFLLIEER